MSRQVKFTIELIRLQLPWLNDNSKQKTADLCICPLFYWHTFIYDGKKRKVNRNYPTF
ncbi:unknown [Prevotella sp. CAG:1185]|nr:unknown [Prevotella sp. CAG:1185]